MDFQDNNQNPQEELLLSLEDIEQIENQRLRKQEYQRQVSRRQDMTPFDRVTVFGTLRHGDKLNDKTWLGQGLVSDELELRAEDARIIEEALRSDDPGVDGIRGALRDKQRNPQGFRPQGFNQLYQTSKNMDRVGTTAYWLAMAIEAKDRDKEKIAELLGELQTMGQDGTLDPKSRELAQQFSKYMRAYDDFRLFGETQYNFDSGEVMYRNENGTVVVEQDGQVIMKPESSEDPRGVGVTCRAITQKYLVDPSKDVSVARALMNTPTTSQMLKGVHSDISGLVQRNDDVRFGPMEEEIIRQEQHSGVRPKPPEVQQQKKKLFNFGGKSKSKDKDGDISH